MKKLIIFLILSAFLAVSCSSSKKAENDADILPDEDAVDEDAAKPDKEQNDEEELEDDAESSVPDNGSDEDICARCKDLPHSTGECGFEGIALACVCEGNYYWSWSNNTGNSKCVSPCDPNPCKKDHISTGECIALSIDSYKCGCVENYFWDGEKCVNPCIDIDCGNFEHSSGECKSISDLLYRCGCEKGFYWWGKEKGCLSKKPAAINVCTGQNKCYDNEKEILCPSVGEDFYGQDAQYAELGYCVPQSFSIEETVSGEPVVVDNNTGMMWQQKIPPVEPLYIGDVNAYCKNLVYGGYDDWRLPSVWDFISIADFGRYSPAIDTDYFPDYGKFWTSSRSEYTYGGDLDTHGYYTTYYSSAIFDFTKPSQFGTTTSEYSNVNPYKQYSQTFNIRCVRGYIISSDAFISRKFGKNLEWNYDNNIIFLKKNKIKHTWLEALKYCSELDYAGISDWRVPNVKEFIFSARNELEESNRSRTSTTKLGDVTFDYSYSDYALRFSVYYSRTKEDNIEESIFCVANDPCENGLFWNGEKCAKNPCAGNPCKSDSNSNGTCTVLDEENYSCGCKKGSWDNELKECIVEETSDETPDADTDEIPDENSDADTHETPDSNNSESGE